MLTEETIQNIKSTIDQTLMNLFHINQKQLQVSEDADYNLDLFDYTINAPGHVPQFFSVSIENHPLMKQPKYTIITTTDHKLENDTWWIHNPSNIVNNAPIPVNAEGEISPQFYETLANQLGLAYFAKQELEPKAIPRLLSVQPGCYTEIEPIDTKVPLNETNLTLIVWDEDDRLNAKLTVPSTVWLERDGYTKNTYPIEHYVYDTDQEQFRLYAQHIGDPTATEVERRPKNTQFYQNLQLHGTPSLRFPFHSPSEFATQANEALWASKTPTSTTYLDNNQFKRAVELFNSTKISEPEKSEDEPSL